MRSFENAARRGTSLMEATKWSALFDGFARRVDAQKLREEEQRSLIAWYDEQTKLVMMMVREVAQERALTSSRRADSASR